MGVITVKNKCLIMISTISVMTLRYTIVLFQYDVLICYLVLVSWHYAITFDCFTFAMCWFATVPWRSAIILCYLPLHSSIGKSSFAVVIFIAGISLWCFVKVTCSSAWHSETSLGQDKLFPAKIIIILIYFLSVALSWLETRRLFGPWDVCSQIRRVASSNNYKFTALSRRAAMFPTKTGRKRGNILI